MHRLGSWSYGKSRFGSMPSSSRRSCSTPIAFVIGTQSTTRVSTSRFTHGSTSYRSISQRASSIVVTGPTRSSPCSAPEKSTSGRSGSAASVARLVISSTCVRHAEREPSALRHVPAVGSS